MVLPVNRPRWRNRFMRSLLLVSTICLVYAPVVAAQAKPKPATHAAAAAPAGMTLAAVKGTWKMETTVKSAAGADTMVTSELVATDSKDGWVTNLAGRPPIPTRVVTMGGDSVVTAAGPFESVVRAGQKVTTYETVHFKGDAAWGTIQAHYSSGQVVKGTLKGTRKP